MADGQTESYFKGCSLRYLLPNMYNECLELKDHFSLKLYPVKEIFKNDLFATLISFNERFIT